MLTVDEAKRLAAAAELDPDLEEFLMYLAGITPRQMAAMNKTHVNGATRRLHAYWRAIPGLKELHESRLPGRPAGRGRRQQWLTKHRELLAFHEKFGVLPSRVGKHPGERPLAVWLQKQRTAKTAGLLDEEQLMLLDQLPGWDKGRKYVADQARHALYLDKLEAFYRDRGRLPRFYAEDPAEHDVGIWLKHRRTAHRQGTLGPALTAGLDTRIPGWRGRINQPRTS